MKKKTKALEDALIKLTSARQQAKQIRKEIEQLRNFIIDAGGNPDAPKVNVVPRNKEIYKRWKDGFHPKEIGPEYGLSAERVRQICQRIEKILEHKKFKYSDYRDLLPYKN